MFQAAWFSADRMGRVGLEDMRKSCAAALGQWVQQERARRSHRLQQCGGRRV